ncbi:hypothetical protein Afil01_31300 [Actinorhabdospora filicis]|uniref:Uncharacterized protein n=1 Tax=Actinorhabdospora filicis TaxID=1785913 RepID=A0A9W6W9T4_9ACTN|nr:hypothetical protein Afil01_31300 [Actinorhabdospora filicis]
MVDGPVGQATGGRWVGSRAVAAAGAQAARTDAVWHRCPFRTETAVESTAVSANSGF